MVIPSIQVGMECNGNETPRSTDTPEQIAQVIDNLKSRVSAIPSTPKALTATVNQLLGKQLAPTEIVVLLEHLQAKGIFKMKGTKVSYELTTSSQLP